MEYNLQIYITKIDQKFSLSEIMIRFDIDGARKFYNPTLYSYAKTFLYKNVTIIVVCSPENKIVDSLEFDAVHTHFSSHYKCNMSIVELKCMGVEYHCITFCGLFSLISNNDNQNCLSLYVSYNNMSSSSTYIFQHICSCTYKIICTPFELHHLNLAKYA